MKISEINILVKDGFSLSAVLREPEGQIKGIVQINGGTGLPKELYAKFSTFLTEAGYVTISFDPRGVGASRPKSLKGFKANIRDWGYLDFTGVFQWVNQKFPDQKKIVVGHSMGGQLVGLMENNHLINHLVLISSGTGHWMHMNSPFKWSVAPIWFFMMPLTTFLFGYVPAKSIGQGENLPSGVALDWIKWSKSPRYFEVDFGSSIPEIYFDQIDIPLTSIQITDDPIANAKTSNKLLTYYKNAEVNVERITPLDVGQKKIGHVGYFSQKSRAMLWPRLLQQLSKTPE